MASASKRIRRRKPAAKIDPQAAAKGRRAAPQATKGARRTPETFKDGNSDGRLQRKHHANLNRARAFVRAWTNEATALLDKGELPGTVGFCLRDLMMVMADAIFEVVSHGDLMTARDLAPSVDLYNRSLAVFGRGICSTPSTRLSINDILADPKMRPRDLLAMVVALEPDWPEIGDPLSRAVFERLGSPALSVLDLQDAFSIAAKLRGCGDPVSSYVHAELSEETRRALDAWKGFEPPDASLQAAIVNDLNSLIRRASVWDKARFKKAKIRRKTRLLLELHPIGDDLFHVNRLLLEDAYPSELSKTQNLCNAELRELLLRPTACVLESRGKSRRLPRQHPLAEIITNANNTRRTESANINLFAEFLRRGWLWAGPNGAFQRCPWHGRTKLPPVANTRAWLAMVVPHLRDVTEGDASKLVVFRYLLAARKPVLAGPRLADDKPVYVWNQVRTRISQAWQRMARKEAKRIARRPA